MKCVKGKKTMEDSQPTFNCDDKVRIIGGVDKGCTGIIWAVVDEYFDVYEVGYDKNEIIASRFFFGYELELIENE